MNFSQQCSRDSCSHNLLCRSRIYLRNKGLLFSILFPIVVSKGFKLWILIQMFPGQKWIFKTIHQEFNANLFRRKNFKQSTTQPLLTLPFYIKATAMLMLITSMTNLSSLTHSLSLIY